MATADREQIKCVVQLLYRPGEVIELRCWLRSNVILNGYFKDWDLLADAAASINMDMTPQLSVYTCLNPCRPELYARRPDKIERAGSGEGVSDAEVLLRRWALVDCDPIRPKGVSATDQQKAAAYELTHTAYRYLVEQLHLPRPIVADSGNGYHLLLPLGDLPNDARSKWAVEQLLKQIARDCTHPGAKLDALFNAARVCKLPGTVARKGADIPEQPHRLAQLLSIPDPLERSSLDQLLAIVGYPPAAQQPAAERSATGSSTWDIPRLLADREIEYTTAPGVSDSGERWTKYSFACPFSKEHADGFALMQWDNGAIFAKCHHDTCEGKGWADLKNIWELNGSAAGVSIADIILPAAQQPQPQRQQLVSVPPLPSYISPPEIPPGAFHGPLGQLVQHYAPRTEASPMAMLVCLLTYYGNALGRRFYSELDGRQYPKLFTCLLGRTATGRKFTADQNACRMLDAITPLAEIYRHTGLSTGEGLIKTLLDHKDGIWPMPAVFQEGEFASVIKRKERRGNSLDDVLRNAWDDIPLGATTRADPLRAVGSHVSLIVHVTPDELKKLLSSADLTSGFGNRFLWIHSQRSQRKPDARGFRPSMAEQQLPGLQATWQQLCDLHLQQAQPGESLEVPLTPAAVTAWEQIYNALDGDDGDDDSGLLPDLCARLPAYLRRLALIYCLAEGSQAITPVHLQAAWAVCEYSRATLDYVYSQVSWVDLAGQQELIEQRADKFLRSTTPGQELPRWQVLHQIYQRHRTAKELNLIRQHLIAKGQLQVREQQGTELWQRQG